MSLPEYSTPPRTERSILEHEHDSPSDANRYYTPISVEVYVYDILRRVKWFSDLQLAHIWCMEQVRATPEEHWNILYSDFVEFADAMDRRWRQSRRGKTVAQSNFYEWITTYEPNVLRNEGIDE